MSGGSYNYLCGKDADMILAGGSDDDLQRMADRLAELTHHDAARETLEVLLEARVARNRLNTRIYRLSRIWKAVEWFDSCDSGPEGITEAVAEYMGVSDGRTDG